MKTIHFFKAEPIYKESVVDSVTIVIDKPIPEVKVTGEGFMNLWRDHLRHEAREFVNILVNTMPQGLTDAILVELLDYKRSLFRVKGPTNER